MARKLQQKKKRKQPYVPKIQALPHHVLAGQQAGLRFGPNGEVFIKLNVLNESKGVGEIIDFLIDTGFNGYLQISEELVSKLGLIIENKSTTKGFDGVEKETGITKTKVKLLDMEIYNFPIQVVNKGYSLIGTRLLKDMGEMLIINYSQEIVTLTKETKVQKKVHKAVDKYSRPF